MSSSAVVIVDIESAGLAPWSHDVVEVAWRNADTGEFGEFIPPHSLKNSQAKALEVNQYWERRLDDQTRWDVDGVELRRFHTALRGNALVGSNPGFDAGFLSVLFGLNGLESEPWSYVPRDIGTYAAGVLNWSIKARPSLPRLCRQLGVEPGNHSAAGDVQATYLCLLELKRIVNSRKAA